MSEYICPHCKKPVYDDEALLCLYCGESLNRPGKRMPAAKWAFIAIACILLLSFLVSIMLH